MPDPIIELGATYRDVTSSFEGIAVSTTRFLFACERVALQRGHNDKGEEIIAVFDATALVRIKAPSQGIVKAIKAALAPAPTPQTGGDRPMPSAAR
jgi:hypothetical protein